MSSGRLITGVQLLDHPENSGVKLWDPYLKNDMVCVLFGSSDTAKSSLIRHLCLDIVAGKTEFLGLPLNTVHKRALIVTTEDMPSDITSALSKVSGTYIDKKFLARLGFYFEFENSFEDLNRILDNTPCDIVVIDVWSDLYKGNPNDFTQVRQSMKEFKKIALKHKTLVVLIHHSIKNSENKASDKGLLNGSQAIEAAPRCVMELRKGALPNQRVLTFTKSNYLSSALKSEALILQFDESTLTFSKVGTKNGTVGVENSRPRFIENKELIDTFLDLKKEGLSFEKCREKLLTIYDEEHVPKVTMLKNIFHSHDKPGGQSESKEISD